MFCSKCGNEVPSNYKYCPNCGFDITGQATNYATQNPTSYTQPPIVINNLNTNTNTNVGYGGISTKSKWVAFLLCLFLGPFGIHRFYVGKIGTGIIWLLSGGICGIGWLIDLLLILCGNFTDSAGCFLKK